MPDLLTAKELKEEASLVDFLSRLGHQPARKHGREKMYYSILRDDDTRPSLSVNDELGVWFDHGTRKGGNIVDLGLALWKHLSFQEVIQKIQDLCLIASGDKKPPRPRIAVRLPNYVIQETKEIGTHPAINDYLNSRQIFERAKGTLKEVYYCVTDEKGKKTQFFAAGWKNEKGVWEVRNKYFKGCLGHKAISFISGNEKNAVVFEGFTNYLSWKSENPTADQSVIVLNSITLLGDGIKKAKAFSSLDIFFDRDQSGFLATKDFIDALPYATDRSSAYEGFNDYNDKLVAAAKAKEMLVTPKGNIFSKLEVPFSR